MSSNNTEIDALQPLLPFFHSKANAILHLRSRNFPHFYTLPPTSPVPLSFRRARSASMNLHFARISEKLLSSRFEPSGIRNNGAGEGRERERRAIAFHDATPSCIQNSQIFGWKTRAYARLG